MNKNIIYVSGLPRSGSTLLCQLLNEHPSIYSSGFSSPVCNIIESIRNSAGYEPFFLSQLDSDKDAAYERLKRGMQGFMSGFLDESECSYVVDKNRKWLMLAETLYELDPDFKMIVCIRNLFDIFASIEEKHRDTILLPFPDNMEPNHIRGRVSSLFGPGGLIGSPLSAISNLNDIPNRSIIEKNIYYVAYEALVKDPVSVMNEVFNFIHVDDFDIEIDNLTVRQHESDSYYRMKYPHKTYNKIKPSFHSKKEVSPRIVYEIVNKNEWFYRQFYPGILEDLKSSK